MNKYLLEEDEEEYIEMPPMSISPKPDWKSYLLNKYKEQGLGDENRQALESKVNEAAPSTGRKVLAALGAGFQGKDSSRAVEALSSDQNQARADLDKFDKRRSSVMSDIDNERKFKAMQKDDEVFARESNPDSPESRMAQDLAKSMGYQGDVSALTAAKFKSISPVLQKKYEIEQRKLDREADRAAKAEAARIKSDEKKEADKIRADEKALKEVPMKQNQAIAAGFGKRIEQSENDFKALKKAGYDRSDITAGIGQVLPNVMKSDNAQRQDQAERNFVNAVLRRESGAAISASEFDSAEKQYFPRAGDGPETLKQKERNRQQVLESLKAEAGPDAWDKVKSIEDESNRKIKVTNGQETLLIDKSDLADAENDGYKVVE